MRLRHFVGLFAICLATAAAAKAEDGKPDILFIMADDLGFADVGYRGSEIKTPNIDKLATEGVRMDSFYGEPVCTPARAALMTGRYPMRYGLQTLSFFQPHLRPGDRRAHAAAGAERRRLSNNDDRQMAPRPRRQEILAAEPWLRLFLWKRDGRDRLFHA